MSKKLKDPDCLRWENGEFQETAQGSRKNGYIQRRYGLGEKRP